MRLGVLSLMAGSTTGVPMSPGYGGYQTATPPPYYPKATYATTSYCTGVYKYYTTKAPEFYTTTYSAPSYYTKATEQDYACCPILLHRGSQVLLCSQLLIVPTFLNTTPFPAATPRFPLITPPKRPSTSLPQSTQPQLRRPSITLSRLATQKLLFRATLNRNTTLMQWCSSLLHHGSPQVLHRRSRLLHNVRCLVYYIEEFKYYPAPNYYQTEVHIYCNSPDYVTTTYAAPTYTPKFWSISLDVLKIKYKIDW
jgi:hypothetical protein